MKTPETSAEWYVHFEKLRLKNELIYQQTGEPRYDSAAYKYSRICDAFRALMDSEKDREVNMKKRINNKNAAVEKLLKDSYSKEEVIKMLEEAVWWL